MWPNADRWLILSTPHSRTKESKEGKKKKRKKEDESNLHDYDCMGGKDTQNGKKELNLPGEVGWEKRRGKGEKITH